MKRYAFAAMLLLTGCQTAAEPDFTPIAGDALKTLIAGKTVTFVNNDTSTYSANGKYEAIGSSTRETGTYTIDGTGVCVTVTAPAAGSHCDQYTLIAGTYFLVDQSGQRFSVGSIAAAR
jgi:hypothetical protein